MTHDTSTPRDDHDRLDPTFLNSRREAFVIFCLWLTGLVWAVSFCYFNGYPSEFDAEQFQTIWGIPSWLFWGIFVPWLIADVFTVWFCFWHMKDDDLGDARDGTEPATSLNTGERISEVDA